MIRFSSERDKDEIINLWKTCFNDSDEFIEDFLNFFPCEKALVYCDQNRIVSMTFLPTLKIGYDGKYFTANYIYALCTHPDYQGLGYAGKLISFTEEYSYESGIPYTLVRPAKPYLFDYYGKNGFEREYYRSKNKLTNDSDLLYNYVDNHIAVAEWGDDGLSYAEKYGIEPYYNGLPCEKDNADSERYLMLRRNDKSQELFENLFMGLTFE